MPEDQELKAETLIADLERLKELRCASCGRRLCGHLLLFSLAMGFKSVPRCVDCLSKALDREPEELREYLVTYIRNRGCYHAAWRWTGMREGACPQSDRSGEPLKPPPAEGTEGAIRADLEWNAGDLGCGDLVQELRIRMQSLQAGQVLKMTTRDPGAPEDIPAWCGLTGHTLVFAKHPVYFIRRKEG